VDQHHVVEIDRLLAERRDVDDARRCARAQEREQQASEKERRKVVDGEAQLMSVGAFAALPASRGRADPGIVHQDIEAVMILAHDMRKLAHPVERRQVGRMESR